MRRVALFGIAAAVAAGCSSDSPRTPAQPDSISLPLRVSAAQHAGVPHNHSVHLSGDQENPPRDTNAQGQAIFHIAPDDESFTYKLIASNIENVVQAHIHCGTATQNGPIIVWLYPSVTATQALQVANGRHDGILAEGTVEADGPDHVRVLDPDPTREACPDGVANFEEVLEKIRTGEAYVNIHTNDQVAPGNTGPGDFPGGEVRGQFPDRD